jgi:hypothetical protein
MNGDQQQLSATTVRIKIDGDNVVPEPSDGFVLTSYLQDLTDRALSYLEVG